jgi:hypothetical protein
MTLASTLVACDRQRSSDQMARQSRPPRFAGGNCKKCSDIIRHRAGRTGPRPSVEVCGAPSLQQRVFDPLGLKLHHLDLGPQVPSCGGDRRSVRCNWFERTSRCAQRAHNVVVPAADGISRLFHCLIRQYRAVNGAGKSAEEKQVDVDAVFVLQIETFLLYIRIAVHRQRKLPEFGLVFAHGTKRRARPASA